MEQRQFLEVIDRDAAQQRFEAALRLDPLGEESVPLNDALGRVLSRDVPSPVDVPFFDRSNFDGFAVRAADTFGAQEEDACSLNLLDESIVPGVAPRMEVSAGQAVSIATGGMLPRGADAIVMVEHAEMEEKSVLVRRAVTPGFGVTYTGTDIGQGEIVLRRGDVLTSRETGVLAAIGAAEVWVWRRPRVAIISTGDEIIAPGQPMRPGLVYDSNARTIADAVRELGGKPVELGAVSDDLELLRRRLADALDSYDAVLLSGGTSKGTGDLSYQAVYELSQPGVVAHGVALKPGKPICLAVHQGKPVVILPGFPTSAIFTFHEFVAPVLRRLSGRPAQAQDNIFARLAVKVNSEIGRTEYLLVGLTERISLRALPAKEAPCEEPSAAYSAFPMGKGSGSVTAFSRADGFVTIDRHEEILEAGAVVSVRLLGRNLQPADLVVIGSHCVGLDMLLSRLQDLGFRAKFLAVGSTAGLDAARRGECDIAPIHLFDEKTGQYNQPFLSEELELVAGYGRRQGVVFRRGDRRFEDRSAQDAVTAVKNQVDCLMINRNQGSGTRILIDRNLVGARPPGYAVLASNHQAVAAAIVQGRADWGVAIETIADQSHLGFLPLANEQYDFVVPRSRANRPAVIAFRELLTDSKTRQQLKEMGMKAEE